MMGYRPIALSFALWFGSACASTEPPPKPPRYPVLPEAPPGPLRFAPDASLFALSLACRPAELPRDNGLDDNCDGHIDGRGADAQLVLALSNPNLVALALSLVGPDGHEVAPSAQKASDACDAQAPFAAQTRSYTGLTGGRYAIVARHVRACATSEGSALSFGIETAQGATAYLTRIEPDQTLTLGHLDVP